MTTMTCPILFQAISMNALAYFLLANLLTGLVNFSIATLHTASCPAVLILAGYTAVLQLITDGMYQRNIHLKLG